MLRHYGRSHRKALLAAYPDIHLDLAKFEGVLHKNRMCSTSTSPNRVWHDFKFSEANFWALNAHFHTTSVASRRPKLSLSYFGVYWCILLARGFWTNPANLRIFFDDFALRRGLDPLCPVGWSRVTRDEIWHARVCAFIPPQFARLYHKNGVTLY